MRLLVLIVRISAWWLILSVWAAFAGHACAHDLDDCETRFAKTLTNSVKWEILRQIKQELIYLPSNREYIEELVGRALRDVSLLDFAEKLKPLSSTINTSVFLLDDAERCAWLFSSDGSFVAAPIAKWDNFELHRLLSRLGASMDGAVTVRAPRSNASKQCSDGTLRPAVVGSQKDITVRVMRARAGLEWAKNKLIPQRLLSKLLETADSRLIISAAGGLGLVPFSAFPLGEGYVIDKFSILFVPGISEIVGAGSFTIDPAGLSAFVATLRSHLMRRNRDSIIERRQVSVRTREIYSILRRLEIHQDPLAVNLGRKLARALREVEGSLTTDPDDPSVILPDQIFRELVGILEKIQVDAGATDLVDQLRKAYEELERYLSDRERYFVDYEGRLVERELRSVTLVSAVRSGTNVAGVQNKPVPEATIVVGDPDLSWDRQFCWRPLPAAGNEARHVARLFPRATLLERKDANHARVIRELGRAQASAKYIYFATHGLSDAINPADGSFLALAGRHMSGAMLRSMKFTNSPLVVLSACQTGLGKTFPGGLFGLAQAWYHAGAQKIATTLWNVDDDATAVLMGMFNDRLRAHAGGGIDVESTEVLLAEVVRKFKTSSLDPVTWAGIAVYGTPFRRSMTPFRK